jgi:hypothetical protein
MVVESWLYGTISPKLQDVTRQHAHTAHAAWLALENRFIRQSGDSRPPHRCHLPKLARSRECWNLIKDPLAPSISPELYSWTGRGGLPTVFNDLMC